MADTPEARPLKDEKLYEVEELKQHSKEEDCWLAIGGEVFDVTEFLDEHPGGFDIILANTGKDATEEFDEIGHSKSARELLQNYKIGKFKGGKPVAKRPKANAISAQARTESSTLVTLLKVLLPVVVILAIFLPKYLKAE